MRLSDFFTNKTVKENKSLTIDKLAPFEIDEGVVYSIHGDPLIEPKSEEYIWVEGYKGTDEDMSCSVDVSIYDSLGSSPLGRYSYWGNPYITKKTQYELNKEETIEGEPVLCGNGFHFCPQFQHVFAHYAFDFKHRYFKVKALVRKEQYQKCLDGGEDKCVAKTIILTEEIIPAFKDVATHYRSNKESNPILKFDGMDITEDMYNAIIFEKRYETPYEAWDSIYIEKMKEYGCAEKFAMYLYERYSRNKLTKIMELADALKAQGVSNDIFANQLLMEARC